MRTWSLRAQHKTTAPTTTTILFGIGERSHASLSSPLGPGHFVDSSGRQRQEGLLPAHLAGGAIPQPCPREGGEEPDLLLLVAWAGQALLLDVLPKRVMWGRNRGLFSKSQTFNNVFCVFSGACSAFNIHNPRWVLWGWAPWCIFATMRRGMRVFGLQSLMGRHWDSNPRPPARLIYLFLHAQGAMPLRCGQT